MISSAVSAVAVQAVTAATQHGVTASKHAVTAAAVQATVPQNTVNAVKVREK